MGGKSALQLTASWVFVLTIMFAGSSLSNPNLGDSCVPKARDRVGNGGVQTTTEATVQDTRGQKLCSDVFFFFLKQAGFEH